MQAFDEHKYLSSSSVASDPDHFFKKITMKLLSLQPFVPSGKDFQKAKEFFREFGFRIKWDSGDYVGFERDRWEFILQNYDNPEFAQNFMLSVGVSNVDELRNDLLQRELPQKFGVRIGEITQQSYGKEMNLIDVAGVCWHFVE